MEALCSPFKNGDMDQYRWYQVLLIPKWQRYAASLETQLKRRGSIAPAAWGQTDRWEIAQRVEAVLRRVCWADHPFQFHPNDPWRVIAEWEIGDASEVQALMEIEESFGISISDTDINAFPENGTFSDFVELVRSKLKP